MKVKYIPPNLESVNDVIHLDDIVWILMRNARKHESFMESRNAKFKLSSKCFICGGTATEAHHIKPVWACAVEFIMSLDWRTRDDLHALRDRYTRQTDGDFCEWHSTKNLMLMCHACHLKYQKIDDRNWRFTLSRRYRLAYTTRWTDGYKRGKNKSMSLSEYAAYYLSEKIRIRYGA